MSLFHKKEKLPMVAAVVVAAGSASRMMGIDKQTLELNGVPVVARSITALEACDRIAEIIIVTRPEKIPEIYDMVKFFGLNKVKTVVEGGETRQESVFIGIDEADDKAEYYAIHDAARPLIHPADIDRCINAAMETGAAAVGVPVKDTIKVCDDNGVIISTPRRDRLWAVQTPQIFEAGLYKRAVKAALHDNRNYTDDCQLIENFGHKVVITMGSHENIKITTPSDIAVASAIVGMREGDVEGVYR